MKSRIRLSDDMTDGERHALYAQVSMEQMADQGLITCPKRVTKDGWQAYLELMADGWEPTTEGLADAMSEIIP